MAGRRRTIENTRRSEETVAVQVLPEPPSRPEPSVLAPPLPMAAPRASLLVPLLVGAAVTVAMGVYGRLHEPTGIAVNVAGFSSAQAVKVWLGSGAAAFAVVQLLSALAMWGRLGGFSPSWAGTAHRWSGRIAFLLAVPVAVHCLYALGFADHDLRTLTHSLLGCLFFGAFSTKMLALPRPGLAGWVLPVLGGVVFTVLIGVWLTSSLWYFTTFGVGT
ncbi:hypothetical protein GA0070614_0088 [Micromonospora coxensis]|uniref:Uncharacterized protein n=2 Tax=Micromonospora coxensis TaxID=356852 RepID=A0A1C5GLM6_9ACTN|nr:hypothetical protein GA0070614_0088 [Micromonospora coxensis]